MRSWIILLLVLLAIGGLRSQNSLSANDSLRVWSDVLYSAKLEQTRNIASDKVKEILNRLILTQSLDKENLNSNIVCLNLPEQNLEIYSWQTEKATKEFEYHCLLKNSNGEIVVFNRESRDYNRIKREEFDHNNWYGAVYYHVIPQSFGKKKYYVLFGFAQNSQGEKFKIIETLSLANKKVLLGLPVFPYIDEDKESTTYHRMLIKYSQSGSCLLRYEELEKQIVFDHMISHQDFNSPESFSHLPDGSYEAFEYNGSDWKYIPKLKVEVQESAPREKPVLDGNSKDLFGQEKKK